MSPLSSKRLAAALFPDRVVWAVREGLRERVVAHGERAGDPVTALGAVLDEHKARKLELSVALSGSLARCLVLPWPAEVEDEDEGATYAAHQFKHVFGDAVDGWEVRFDTEARGAQRLACGIERSLIAAVRDAAKSRGVRLASIQPLLVSVFNRCRRAIGSQPTLFFLAEPGRYHGASLEGVKWHALRSGRLASDAPQELAEALAREAALFGKPPARVLLYAPEHGELGAAGMDGLRRIGPTGGAAPAYVHGKVH